MVAGIVLAGGRSARMGTAKAGVEWHGSTLLRHVGGILARSVDGPVVIVRARGQALPRLPADWEVVEDARAGRGPLEALAAGLRALSGRAAVAFVASTDLPLLHPSFVGAVVSGLGAADDICVPVVGHRAQPLAAAYRPDGVAPAMAGLLAADRLRLGLLLDCCRVRRLGAAELLADAGLSGADPRLESLVNLNGPGDYAAARARPAPEVRVDGEPVRAATLGGAAAAAGLVLGRDGVAASLNGRPAGADPELPLVTGDVVAFAQE